MLILTQERGAIVNSDNYRDYGVNQNNELYAVPKDDTQQAILLGRFSSAPAARRCLTKFFNALSEGKKDFKVPYSQWRKAKG